MKIFNYSGEDVAYAIVSFEDSNQPGVVYATFPNVTILSNDGVLLSTAATLPSAEVDRWSQGASPAIRIQFMDSTGQNRDERVEVSPGPPEQ